MVPAIGLHESHNLIGSPAVLCLQMANLGQLIRALLLQQRIHIAHVGSAVEAELVNVRLKLFLDAFSIQFADLRVSLGSAE